MPKRAQRIRNLVIEKKGRHCTYCGAGPLYRRALYVDRVASFSEDGDCDINSLAPSCGPCNLRKGGMEIGDYVRDRLAQLAQEENSLRAILDEVESGLSPIAD